MQRAGEAGVAAVLILRTGSVRVAVCMRGSVWRVVVPANSIVQVAQELGGGGELGRLLFDVPFIRWVSCEGQRCPSLPCLCLVAVEEAVEGQQEGWHKSLR